MVKLRAVKKPFRQRRTSRPYQEMLDKADALGIKWKLAGDLYHAFDYNYAKALATEISRLRALGNSRQRSEKIAKENLFRWHIRNEKILRN